MNDLPLTNKEFFYKYGNRCVNKYKNEIIYLTDVNFSITIHDYYHNNNREGILIKWNYNVFKYYE